VGHTPLVRDRRLAGPQMGRGGAGAYFVRVSIATVLQMSITAMNWER
jgi:hypothetical protein